jgi:hypothetical protein
MVDVITGRSLIKKSKTRIRVLADPEEAEEARD